MWSRPWRNLLPCILLCLLLSGCQDGSRTFAGFTFGGGGNTFSCEPADWTSSESGFELRAGSPGGTSVLLSGTGPVALGEPATLNEASVKVPSQQAPATLVEGTLVCQNQEGALAHGSFDLKVRTSDGREFPVVGSFTASRKNASQTP